jgi:hypothetical protein
VPKVAVTLRQSADLIFGLLAQHLNVVAAASARGPSISDSNFCLGQKTHNAERFQLGVGANDVSWAPSTCRIGLAEFG